MRILIALSLLLFVGCGSRGTREASSPRDAVDLLKLPWTVAAADGTALHDAGIRNTDLTANLRSIGALEEIERTDGVLRARLPEDAEDDEGSWSMTLLGLHVTEFDSLTFWFESRLPGRIAIVLRYGDGESWRSTVVAGGVGSQRSARVDFPARLRGWDVRPTLLSLAPEAGLDGPLALSRVTLHSSTAATRTDAVVAHRSLRAVEIRPGRSLRWDVQLPAQARLSFASAIAERAWTSSGDGSFLRLELIQTDGTAHELWSRALAPGQNPTHRDWFEEDLDLTEFAHQRVGLRFSSLPTPPVAPPFERHGDSSDDAALIGTPRIYSQDERATNVVILLIDSLRADRLSAYGYEREVDPELRQFASEALLFERAYAPAPWTVPSTASLLTGLYPNLHGKGIVRGDRTSFREDTFFLTEALANAGYRTGILSNNPLIDPENGFDRGIDEFDIRANEDGLYYGGERLTRAAEDWLDRHSEQAFFLYVHFFDPHYPYQAPPGFTRRYVEPELESSVQDVRVLAGDANDVRRRMVARAKGRAAVPPPVEDVRYLEALYDAETNYADLMIGRLLNALDERGLAERTLIMVTSDHGEEFLEHGFLTHGHSLYEELLHVPLIVRFPDGTGRAHRIQTPVSLVDLAPTVLSFLDLALPEASSLSGRDLYRPLREGRGLHNSPIFAHSAGAGAGTGLPQHGPKRAVIDWPIKLIDDIDGPSVFFDLGSDPEERRWREAAKKIPEQRRRQLEAFADSALALPEDWRENLQEMSPQLLRDLKALGYVE